MDQLMGNVDVTENLLRQRRKHAGKFMCHAVANNTRDAHVDEKGVPESQRKGTTGSVESEEQCQTPPTPSKLHRHCETTQKARSPRRPPLLEKAWGKLQSLCSINAAPGRTSGYYRIHPKTATRLYCNMMDEKEESFVEIAELPSEVTTGEKPLRMKCDDSANGVAEFTIDKILLCLCALIITIGYPIAIFFVLSE